MKRQAALVLAIASSIASCAEPPPRTPGPVPTVAASSAPPVESAPPPEPPLPELRPEVLYTGARADRLARLTGIARGVFAAFANEKPQPVTRGFSQTQYVQWSTDRKERGAFSWVEASTTAFHHPPEPAEKIEACASPIPFGEEVKLARGRVKLVRGDDHDELLVADDKAPLAAAKLPRGASHGACAGPDGTRVWIAWSTPEAPPELSSVSLRDGKARALRIDARPGLAALMDAKSGVIELARDTHAAFVEPVANAKASAVYVAEGDAPLAAWDPFARFLVEAGVAVLRVRAPSDAAVAAAKSRWKNEPWVIASKVPEKLPEHTKLLVVSERDTIAKTEAWPNGTFLVGIGDAAKQAIEDAKTLRTSDVAWSVAPGLTAWEAVPSAWARAADEAIGAP